MDLIAEMTKLIAALNANGVQYALCGGLALGVHGFPRATQDIDLLVPEHERSRLQEVAKTVGFWIPSGRMPFKPKSPLEMEIWRVSKAVGPQLISLDMIVVSPCLESVWNSRIVVRFDGLDCGVVSREGLITMKTIAGRHQDLADIERLKGESSATDPDTSANL
jgi:hypothetical protein